MYRLLGFFRKRAAVELKLWTFGRNFGLCVNVGGKRKRGEKAARLRLAAAVGALDITRRPHCVQCAARPMSTYLQTQIHKCDKLNICK